MTSHNVRYVVKAERMRYVVELLPRVTLLLPYIHPAVRSDPELRGHFTLHLAWLVWVVRIARREA